MRDPDGSAQPETVRRIVVLRPNHRIGNTLLLTPLMQELEALYPAARVDLVSAGGVAKLVFARYPQLSLEHAFPAKSYQHPAQVLRVLWRMRKPSYDLAIDPTIRSRAGRFLLHWVHSQRRVGYAWGIAGKDRLLTDAVSPKRAPAHHAEIPVYLVRSALRGERGSAAAQVAQAPMDLRLSDAERREGESELAKVLGETTLGTQPVLGIFAHATGAKCLPTAWWRGLIARLQARAPAIRLVEFLPEDARSRLDGVVPGTFTPGLRLLGAKLAATSLVVIADGGVMHLADAAGAKVLALFTTTAPAQYGPRRPGSESLTATGASPDFVADRIIAKLQPQN